MSALLNALKKAEEEKRRRAALATQAEDADDSAQITPANVDEIVPDVLPAEAWVFEPLPETQAELVLASEPMDLAPESAAVQEAASPLSLSALDEPERAETSMTTALDAEVGIEPPVDSEHVEPVAELSVASEPLPLANTAQVPSAANPVASSRTTSPILDYKRKTERSLWPWLLLGGGLLLLGLVIWFTWEYQQLTQASSTPLPSARSLPASAASPVEVSEQSAIDSALKNTPLPIGEGYVAEGDKIKEAQQDTIQGIGGALANPTPLPRLSQPPSAPGDEVRFIRTPVDNLNPLQQAWEAYQQGDWVKAEVLYRKILNNEPRQRDALLGLAAIYVQRGQSAQAAGIYDYLLGLNPQDQAAQQAKLALNPEQINAEQVARLQQSQEQEGALATSPLVLGQYYASRSRWQEAQAQFFQAWSTQPDNPDLAFNLAISLDHLQQQRLAAEFYQKALDLALRKQATFDRAAAESRLAQLRLAGF